MLEKGQTLLLKGRIDRSIVGGYTVRVGDKYLDLSVKKYQQDLDRLLAQPIVL